jgi:hypothetical protein
MPRRFPIFQFPNPPLIAAMALEVLARTADPETARKAAILSRIAMLVWAYQEITAGANWLRRLIGVGAAAQQVVALASAWAPATEGGASSANQEVRAGRTASGS